MFHVVKYSISKHSAALLRDRLFDSTASTAASNRFFIFAVDAIVIGFKFSFNEMLSVYLKFNFPCHLKKFI